MNLECIGLLAEDNYEFGIHAIIYIHVDIDDCGVYTIQHDANSWTLYHHDNECEIGERG